MKTFTRNLLFCCMVAFVGAFNAWPPLVQASDELDWEPKQDDSEPVYTRVRWPQWSFGDLAEMLDLRESIKAEFATCVRKYPDRDCELRISIGTLPVRGQLALGEEELESIENRLQVSFSGCQVFLMFNKLQPAGTVSAYVVGVKRR